MTDPAPEGKVLEIDGDGGNKPELAIKSGGVWRSYVDGEKTKVAATIAPFGAVAPRRWRLRADMASKLAGSARGGLQAGRFQEQSPASLAASCRVAAQRVIAVNAIIRHSRRTAPS